MTDPFAITIDNLIDWGYRVSNQIDQKQVTRANTEVLAAYVMPILGQGDEQHQEVIDATVALTFLRLLQTSAYVTRAGAKEKTTPQSYTVDRWQLLSEMAEVCAMRIAQLRRSQWAEHPNAEVTDICGIYFRTQYFS